MARPKPPAVVEEMVGTASKHLVEEMLGHKLTEGGVRGQHVQGEDGGDNTDVDDNLGSSGN